MDFDILKENIANLDAKDFKFAASLISQFDKKGKLSDKQLYWVGVLAGRAMGAEGEPKLETTKTDGLTSIVDFMINANTNLKFPKINLKTKSGYPVKLMLAGPKAKKPGTVTITDGGPYGSNIWYGRVLTDGTWEKSGKGGPCMDEVGQLLQDLAGNPDQVIVLSGIATGTCCFCNRDLTTTASVDVGYGPVCAENFDLPWGNGIAVEHAIMDAEIAGPGIIIGMDLAAPETRRTKKKMADEGDD